MKIQVGSFQFIFFEINYKSQIAEISHQWKLKANNVYINFNILHFSEIGILEDCMEKDLLTYVLVDDVESKN